MNCVTWKKDKRIWQSVYLVYQLNTYAIDNVADPFPALASTTSVPPSCVLLVRDLISSSGILAFNVAYKQDENFQKFKKN